MADKPVIAARTPKPAQLEAGKTYRWCSCGRSKNQPWHDAASCTAYCDAHRVEFQASESGEAYMCMCKATKNAEGRCDGTHRKLPAGGAGAASGGDKPVIAARKPKPVQLEAGKTYRWCSCGRSKNQPWHDADSCNDLCDTRKVEFEAKESGEAYMCMCKATKNEEGRCDGTHRKLPAAGDIEDLLKSSASAPAGGGGDDESTPEEPTLAYIKQLAREGAGHHGPMVAMGFPRQGLPSWDDIQFVTAQLARRPLMEDVPVDTVLTIGPAAKKPLVLDIPIFVSDMSYGALSREAKIALSRGAEMAGTGICSGEGGSLPAERSANTHYFYEIASAMFGYDEAILTEVGAVHFKLGQAAKTGTGGHLPANKVTEEIAAVRGLKAGQDAVSPPTFKDIKSVDDFRKFAARIREVSGGVPVGVKLSAQRVEDDIRAALDIGVDYIILDGRGGGTGAAPAIFRNHISVPTIPALARARRCLDSDERGKNVTLIATGGLRTDMDFLKAMALGADGVAIANSAIQSIGCVAARMCNTNMCPAGVATQRPELRKLLDVEKGARQLNNFLRATVSLMSVMCRACGHDALSKMELNDLTTFKRDMHELSGVPYGGFGLMK